MLSSSGQRDNSAAITLHDELMLTEMLYGHCCFEQWNLNASEKCVKNIWNIFLFFLPSSWKNASKRYRAPIAVHLSSFHYLHIASFDAAGADGELCGYDWACMPYASLMRLTENLNCNLIIHSQSHWSTAQHTHTHITPHLTWRGKKREQKNHETSIWQNGEKLRIGWQRYSAVLPIGIFKLAVAKR